MSFTEEALDAVITRRRQVADRIVEIQVQRADGGSLPAFSAGAHIEIETPSGLLRNSSLTSEPSDDPRSYEIAVALDPRSEGGSSSVHERAQEGDPVQISAPKGGYEPDPEAEEILLIAGGVGITPMASVYRAVKSGGGPPVRVIYLCRTRSAAAYLEVFDADTLTFHAKEEQGGARFDLWKVLDEPGDRRVFCCGPGPLLDEVRALTMHWRASHLHFEDFRGVAAVDPYASPFAAVWEPTGTRVEVAQDETLLDALTSAGADIPSSCRSGTCGTCRIRVHAGEIQHRDLTLSEEERDGVMLCCVSRAEGEAVFGPVSGVHADSAVE